MALIVQNTYLSGYLVKITHSAFEKVGLLASLGCSKVHVDATAIQSCFSLCF